MRVRAHVFVSGLVQGVSFRWYTVEQARHRGLGGWVRNLPDGRVEAVFEGDREAVESMVEWIRTGPRHARVSDVEVDWEEEEGLFEFDYEF
ncbi:MAG: acylphosphatase [Actinomycetota bacterium]